jgi:SSS family solute:Na+ symporter
MHLTDWALFLSPILLIAAIVAYANPFTRTVADFISGGRCAERYLLAVASNTGAIVFVALWEPILQSGFTLRWWDSLTPLVPLLIAIYGFVGYRMRETRALTLAQFFELRYSKSFRVFAGILGAIAGMACDGIIAAVEARFFVYFLGLPEVVTIAGYTIDTYIPLMGVFLSISALISLFGGFVAVMLIDCIEGILSQVFYLLLIYALLTTFHWHQIVDSMSHQPPGKSLVNPFDTSQQKDFNIWFVLMRIFGTIYVVGAWRNGNGNATAPLNAHEGRMGGLLGSWREIGKGEVILLLGICGFAYLMHPDFAAGAHAVQNQLSHISQPYIREQMSIPIAVAHMLPPYVKDAFCALMLMEMLCGTSNRSQSWGSIFIQDVVVPLRKTPLSPKRHVFLIKLCVVGVMLYFFVFGALFRQTQYIIMWFSLGSAIFMGGAGSVIIGGLYWKKGTTVAAWCSLITGSVLAVGGITMQEVYDKAFPLNGTQISFYASLIAIAVYIVVSLLTCHQPFDMDRMLHRGKYAVMKQILGEATEKHRNPNLLLRLIGIDKDFSLGDRIIASGLFTWTFLWVVVFVIGTVWNLVSPWPLTAWFTYWHVTAIGIPLVITVVTTFWFTWGGTRDIYRLFGRLKREKSNVLDDGTVIGHRNAADAAIEEAIDAGAQGKGAARLSTDEEAVR